MRELAANNIFIDTNVLIGAFAGIAKDEKCFRYLCSVKGKRLYASSLSIAQLVSVFQKKKTNDEIRDIVGQIMHKINILNFYADDIKAAIAEDGADIEDSIQYVNAKKMKCLVFVTNNLKDYRVFSDIVPTPPAKISTIVKP